MKHFFQALQFLILTLDTFQGFSYANRLFGANLPSDIFSQMLHSSIEPAITGHSKPQIVKMYQKGFKVDPFTMLPKSYESECLGLAPNCNV